MIARELMTERPALITASDTVATAANLMRTRGVGMLPVVQDLEHRQLVGILTDRDIVIRHVAAGHGSGAKVNEHMTRDPLATVRPTATVQEIADNMTRYQVRRLPVVDEHGAVIGVVAQADLAVVIGPTDPELIERVIEGISRPGALVP